MNLRIFDSLDDLSRALARTLLAEVVADRANIIGISGGSTPRRTYELLAREPALASKPVTWVLIDERYVPREHADSNSAMIRAALFPDGIPSGHRFLDFDTKFDDAGRSAEAFEGRWRELGIEGLDCAILGVGEDGHTASLFPRTPVLDVTDRIAAAVYVPRLDQWRVTLTMPVLQAARLKIVVAGESKIAIVREAAQGADLPVTRAMAGDGTWWFVAGPYS